MSQVIEMVALGWRLYSAKIASGLLLPDNEKMMQLQLAQIFQTLAPLYESSADESYKVLLEVPVQTAANKRIIDLVLEHRIGGAVTRTAVELKCFRLYAREGGGKRGAQNLGMYDYWEDIENIESYCVLPEYEQAYQLTLTDDPYYVEKQHAGPQVAVYSTCQTRSKVTGTLIHAVANRKGSIALHGIYSMDGWRKDGTFYFISQQAVKRLPTSKESGFISTYQSVIHK
jgi:hypothetical protein